MHAYDILMLHVHLSSQVDKSYSYQRLDLMIRDTNLKAINLYCWRGSLRFSMAAINEVTFLVLFENIRLGTGQDG